MDNHENEYMDPVAEEVPVVPVPAPEDAAPEQPQSFADAAPVKKESPFADSPYITTHREPEITPGFTMPRNEGPKPEKKNGGKVWKRVLAVALGCALVIGSCGITAMAVNGYWEARTAQMTQDMNERLNLVEQQLQAKIDQVGQNGNSVSGTPNVTVDGLTPGQVYAQNVSSTVLVYSQAMQMGQQSYSTGSGFILSEDGYVVTNYHVIEGGTAFTVVTSDNVQHEAVLVGGDQSNDVAVLKMEGQFRAVELGSSDALIVGDQVAAIGNPLGELTSTLTVGYVSAKGRYVTTESTTINMIQTDCAINSGNSGGPLFNMKGQVVGITTAKYSGTSGSGATIEGIGFAIPIDDVIAIVEDLVEFGYVNSAYLGIEVNNSNEITAGLPSGAYVSKVTPGYCAEKAGIQAGDYIVELDGQEVTTMNDLTRLLRRLDPGTVTTVVVLRGNQRITLEITLDARPENPGQEEPSQQMPVPDEGEFEDWYEYFEWYFGNQKRP